MKSTDSHPTPQKIQQTRMSSPSNPKTITQKSTTNSKSTTCKPKINPPKLAF
jgi:hypothetical protein